ncbi:MAG: hypothetical protein M3437_06955 [Chloroflexota bacterium]|nr:hypothetical protein [Chloroflexota bacterium]MDQ5865786.1 hypothetical protein [Chloroflexota bacterium]
MDESHKLRNSGNNDGALTDADQQVLAIVERIVNDKAHSRLQREGVSGFGGTNNPLNKALDSASDHNASDGDDDNAKHTSLHAMCVQLATSAAEPGDAFRAELLARIQRQLHAQKQAQVEPASAGLDVERPNERPALPGGSLQTASSDTQRPTQKAAAPARLAWSHTRSSRFARVVFAVGGVAAMLVILAGMWVMLKLRSDFATLGRQTPTSVAVSAGSENATALVPPGGSANSLTLVPNLRLLRSQVVGAMTGDADNQPMMAWSPDGRLIASTGSNVVAVMEAVSGKTLFISPFADSGTARAMSWSPDGRMIAVGLEYDEVVIIDVTTRKKLHRLSGPTSEQPPNGPTATPTAPGVVLSQTPIVSLAWSPDSRFLAAAPAFPSSDNTIERTGEVWVWDVTTGARSRNLSLSGLGPYTYLSGSLQAATRVAWSPDGRALASISRRNELLVWWETSTGSELRRLREGSFRWEGYRPLDFRWSPDGRTIAVLTQYSVEIWDPYGGNIVRSLPDPPPLWRAPGPVGTAVPSVAPPSATPTYVYAGEQYGPLRGAAWSPQGDRIVTFDGDETGGTVRVWEVSSGKQLHSRSVKEDYISGMPVAWSPDGRVLTSKGAAIEFWDAQANVKLGALSTQSPWGFAWSPDGSLLAVHAESKIEIWADAAEVEAGPTATPVESALPASTSQAVNATSLCGSWEIVPGPKVNGVEELLDASALTDNDIWAVGYHKMGPNSSVDGTPAVPGRVPPLPTRQADSTLIVRWDGNRWNHVPSPNVLKGNNRLNAVAAIAKNDAWAVGSYEAATDATADVRQRALILHWDGTSWLQVPLPDLGPESSQLLDVAHVSPTEVWAVGYSGGDLEPSREAYAPTRTLALRWDGSRWSQVDIPSPGQTRNQLYGLSVVGQDAIWAVGRYSSQPPRRGGGGVSAEALILFWDGAKWEQFAAPPMGNSFTSVSAVGPDAAWIVGSAGTEGSNRSAMLRWDGNAWSAQDLPVPTPPGESPPFNDLPEVLALSPTDVWAVGSYDPDVSGREMETLAMHWDGVQWSHIPTPNLKSATGEINGTPIRQESNSLNGIASSPSGDIWAVGAHTWTGPSSEMLILRYRGSASACTTPTTAPDNPADTTQQSGTSTLTAYPHLGTPTGTIKPVSEPSVFPAGECSPAWYAAGVHTQGTLEDVAAISDKDIWAVGASRNAPADTLTMHWDGTSWGVVPSPNIGQYQNVLLGVSALATDDVWAVGYYRSADNNGQSQPLAMHWDGRRWSFVTTPEFGEVGAVLNDVTALAPDNVWAVGTHFTGSGGESETLTMHWDGKTWSRIASPDVGPANRLEAVEALSANDVWAVGNYYTRAPQDAPLESKTLVLRWDGTKWRVIASPNVAGMSNNLSGVGIVSETDVWAVGSYNGGEHIDTLTMHWDGKEWRIVPSPRTQSHNGAQLHDVAVYASDNVWAVGGDNGDALVQHWDGKEWRVQPSADFVMDPSDLYLKSLAGVAKLPSGEMLAVGGLGVYAYAALDTPTIIRYSNQPCAQGTHVPPAVLPQETRGAILTGTAQAMPTSRTPPTATSTPPVTYGSLCGTWTMWDAKSGLDLSNVDSKGAPRSNLSGELSDVSALSANDVWAVGRWGNDGLIVHWDGRSWTRAKLPTIGPQPGLNSRLSAVAAISSDDVWAVGSYTGVYDNHESLTVTLHWDGKEWRVVPSPNLPNIIHYPADMAASGPDDVWVVGQTALSSGAMGTERVGMLLMHWDGSSWRHVPPPDLGDGYSGPNAVSALSKDDVWVGGVRSIAKEGQTVEYRTLALHWDGRNWRNTSSDLGGFRGLLALSRNDVWAAGNTLVEHWDGTKWSIVPIPNLGERGSIDKLAAPPDRGRVWGIMSPEGGLVAEWDGRQWSAVRGLDLDAYSTHMLSLAATSADEVWVVGTSKYMPWVGRIEATSCSAGR